MNALLTQRLEELITVCAGVGKSIPIFLMMPSSMYISVTPDFS
jgi:hypothetical protein